MPSIRFSALNQLGQRQPVEIKLPSGPISAYFATNVFGADAMQTSLSADTYKRLTQAMASGEKIDYDTADAVATAMKRWAMDKGATHFTHWFQPLTGATAEKHDAFFEISEGRAIERFQASALVQQEPDASSFPSGGIRTTFEARGYTAWDPTSPAFLYENGGAKTLCIPTVFVSYTGEALDHKAPLLRSMELIDKAATAVCQMFDKDISYVKPTLGPEQEYFVIDRALFFARPDLMLTGRTVFGHSPAKGQQLDDHYFGSIPQRIHHFMMEFEVEAHKLGIPIRTRHNEVAPSQYECAPTFEEVNVAVDHNQLLMDLMEKVAERHQLKVLFHEKPFAGVNGSGKHCNWSLVTNTGRNLLAPGRRPKENLVFLTFFVCTLKAVHDYADLLRASVASAGNDYRLGANEAPPAIISAFIGSQLSNMLDSLEETAEMQFDKGDNVYLKLGINKIPEIMLDNTDRNRTSPFAFTGNKFEFRAVGASATISDPVVVLNTIVANQLLDFKEEVERQFNDNTKREVTIINVLREYIEASKKIRFEGNNYAEEWMKEAKRRKLSNVTDTPRALDFMITKQARDLFSRLGVFTERELEARHEIRLEAYQKKIQIEARVMGDLAINHIIPTAVAYQNKLIDNVRGLKELGLDQPHAEVAIAGIKDIAGHITSIRTLVEEMVEARKRANKVEDARERAILYCDEVASYFNRIRYHVDKLEQMVDDEDWPLMKYRELLFMR
ncbi:glutamine synthetase [Catalinimonas alkaloidigena]|uniref:Glutamine synthetase n=1 Tax=Catalinimonas alkaloidigena TaxID=1075417 RepID=A0A1G9K6S1_9BACT|nr:glutamine synthetase III [Catalinimonas alkaloidigena]SDL45580.1 glutamine synthetase [Catalinimonas alkaloidigena]